MARSKAAPSSSANAQQTTPPRRLRSTALRHARVPLGDLTKRRSHYERVASYHLNVLQSVTPQRHQSLHTQLTPKFSRNRTRNRKAVRDESSDLQSTDPDLDQHHHRLNNSSNNDSFSTPVLSDTAADEGTHPQQMRIAISAETAERALEEDDEEDNDRCAGDATKYTSKTDGDGDADEDNDVNMLNEKASVSRFRELLQALKTIPNLDEYRESHMTDSIDNDGEDDDDDNPKPGDDDTVFNATPASKSRSESTLEKPRKQISPLDEDDDIRGLAEILATERFVTHECDKIRLVTACCFVEILRITAPDPPVDARKLNDVCTLFIEQLAVLVAPNDPMEVLRFSLLEQLAVIKAFVIFADNDHIVCELFACFYATARTHQSSKVRQYFVDILSSLLEEMTDDDIGNVTTGGGVTATGGAISKRYGATTGPSREILDALLAPLVPALEYSAAAIAVAERVVQASEKVLKIPLCGLLNESIRALRIDQGTLSALSSHGYYNHHSFHSRQASTRRRASPGGKAKMMDIDSSNAAGLSEHHRHIVDLILSISRVVSSDVLIYVVPNLEPQIRSEDVATRLGALQLLARLFTSSMEMVTHYPGLFMEFLNRRGDSDPRVRTLVVSFLGDLLLLLPSQADELESMLVERIFDADERVRVVALHATVRAADVVAVSTLERVLTRLQDKSELVRREALTQAIALCTTVPKHSATFVPLSSSEAGPSADAVAIRNRDGGILAESDEEGNGDDDDGVVPSGLALKSSNNHAQLTQMSDGDRAQRLENRIVRLAKLPGHLLGAYLLMRRSKDASLVTEFERGLFEKVLLPSSKSDDQPGGNRGLRRIAIFLSFMDQRLFMFFGTIVAERARAHHLLLKIAQLRINGRSSLSGNGQALSESQSAASHSELTSHHSHSEGRAQESPAVEQSGPNAASDEHNRASKTNKSNSKAGASSAMGAPLPMSRGNIEEARKVSKQLAGLFSAVKSDVVDHCCTIATAVDLRIHSGIVKAVDCKSSSADANEAASDIISRLGSKSKTGLFFSAEVLPKCKSGPFSATIFAGMCDLAIELSRQPRGEQADNALNEHKSLQNALMHSRGDAMNDDDDGDDEYVSKAVPKKTDDGGNDRLNTRILFGLMRYFSVIGPYFRESLAANTERIVKMLTLPITADDWAAETVLIALKLACNVPQESLHAFDNDAVAATIKRLLKTDHPRRYRYGSKLAKWATRLNIVIVSKSGVECKVVSSLEAFGTTLTDCIDEHNWDMSQLIGPLAATAQLAKHAPAAFKKIAIKCFDFARVLLNGVLNKVISEWVSSRELNLSSEALSDTEHESESSSSSSSLVFEIVQLLGRGETEELYRDICNDAKLCLTEVTSRACKVLVYGLRHVDLSEEFDRVVETFVKIIADNRGDIFHICKGSTGLSNSEADVESSGQTPSPTPKASGSRKKNEPKFRSKDKKSKAAPSNEPITDDNIDPQVIRVEYAMKSTIRLAAARALLYIARHERKFRKLDPGVMVQTMLNAQDEHPVARICFARVVMASVMRKGLSLRWIACLPLMAVDPVDENRNMVHTMLVQTLQHRRKLCERLRNEGKSRYVDMLPEAAMPNLMWVLANLPGVEIEQEAGFPESSKCLEFLLDCLLESREYANVLNEYIESVTIAEDATEHLGAAATNENMTDGSKYEDDDTSGQTNSKSINSTSNFNALSSRMHTKGNNSSRHTKTETNAHSSMMISASNKTTQISARSLRLREFGRIASRLLRQKMQGRKWQLVEQMPPLSLPKDLFRIVREHRAESSAQPRSSLPLTKEDNTTRETTKGVVNRSTALVRSPAITTPASRNQAESSGGHNMEDVSRAGTSGSPESDKKKRGRSRKRPPRQSRNIRKGDDAESETKKKRVVAPRQSSSNSKGNDAESETKEKRVAATNIAEAATQKTKGTTKPVATAPTASSAQKQTKAQTPVQVQAQAQRRSTRGQKRRSSELNEDSVYESGDRPNEDKIEAVKRRNSASTSKANSDSKAVSTSKADSNSKTASTSKADSKPKAASISKADSDAIMKDSVDNDANGSRDPKENSNGGSHPGGDDKSNVSAKMSTRASKKAKAEDAAQTNINSNKNTPREKHKDKTTAAVAPPRRSSRSSKKT